MPLNALAKKILQSVVFAATISFVFTESATASGVVTKEEALSLIAKRALCVVKKTDFGGMKSTSIWKFKVEPAGDYIISELDVSNNVGVAVDGSWREKSSGKYIIKEGRYSDTGTKYFLAVDDGESGSFKPNLLIGKGERSVAAYNGRQYLGIATDCRKYD